MNDFVESTDRNGTLPFSISLHQWSIDVLPFISQLLFQVFIEFDWFGRSGNRHLTQSPSDLIYWLVPGCLLLQIVGLLHDRGGVSVILNEGLALLRRVELKALQVVDFLDGLVVGHLRQGTYWLLPFCQVLYHIFESSVGVDSLHLGWFLGEFFLRSLGLALYH